MASAREQILAAMLTALNTNRPSGVPVATRTRLALYTEGALPAINVYPVKEQGGRIGGHAGPALRRKLAIHVDCIANGDLPDQQLDALIVWCTKTLDGNLLGGLVNSLEPGEILWQYDNAESEYATATIQFFVDYATKTGNEEINL